MIHFHNIYEIWGISVKVGFSVVGKLIFVFGLSTVAKFVYITRASLTLTHPPSSEEILPPSSMEDKEVDIAITGEIFNQPVYGPFR